MVKLQKRFAYTYKGRDYYKHVVTIPDAVVHNLGWKSDIELVPQVENNKLIFKQKKSDYDVD